VTHKASPKFWKLRNALPEAIQNAADKAFQLLKRDARHRSLQFKKLSGSDYWSFRVNEDYRALAVSSGDVWAWFWIGPHDEYNSIIKGK
jgi:hypothetical protein